MMIKNPKMKFLLHNVASLTIVISAYSFAVELPDRVRNQSYYDNGNPSKDMIFLGQSLFFDKIMSGNKNISCATCYNPFLGRAHGLSLGVGEVGQGMGRYPTTREGIDCIDSRIGRHAPHLFNLDTKKLTALNWNDFHPTGASFPSSGLVLQSVADTPTDLYNVLAGQALFPIANLNEMVGDAEENDVALAAQPGPRRYAAVLVERLRDLPDYVNKFSAAFEDVTQASDIGIQHYAKAVSAFQAFAFRSDNSQFDHYLKGNTDALTDRQIRGMELFYGDAGCSGYHSRAFQTDHKFYGIAMPQVDLDPESKFLWEDRGLAETTDRPTDWARFRTPSLRNIWLTAP